ncbi:cation-translocating P-type ATPase [Methylocystis parvus]|uniref:HAD-IC family P-type ATPase n=1 Tax=Methylocystis parvus TaxID=134 RepID=A0A6B8M1S3_9HYPH|nr:HAD-IC family P-type ATPase [Methylocystis parvus]QGM97754.1 HAD-IC family P-type ATPase [Methylocystis parvus]WBK01941.1 HAD-IC family P-type ATPase [Methylocystis parvus OBBP]
MQQISFGDILDRDKARIVHAAVPGRVRLRHVGLLLDGDAKERVEKALGRLPGVKSVKASARTGSALVYFDFPATPESLAAALEAAAGGAEAVAAPEILAQGPNAAFETGAVFHAASIDAVASWLETRPAAGLTAPEVAARLAKWGPNETPRAERRSAMAIFAEQMTSLPIALLAASAAMSLATGGVADAVMIAAVVLVNAGIATATEREADRTIAGLMDEGPQPATAIRDGARVSIRSSELTIGDILVIERGAFIPADARLIESDDLSVNESPLTGEAHPAAKDAHALLPPDTVVSDRRNMIFQGTAVTSGSGAAIVTAVGAMTEMGRIQELLGALRPPETPIQRELGEVGRELVIVNGLICASVFALGMMRGHPLAQTLRSAISLAVAAIPEGLPAVATTTLAIGIQHMRKRKVFVRKIDAVETLGAVEVVGLDKTGTLTENRMAAVVLHLDGAALELRNGRLLRGGQTADDALCEQARKLFETTTLCSDAVAMRAEAGYEIDGTPTETALLTGGVSLGVDPVELRLSARVLASAARGDGRKRMSTLHETSEGARLLCVKGDPLEVLARCAKRRTAAGAVPMEEAAHAQIVKANTRMAGDALRVLGVACLEGGGDPRDEADLVWLGLVGMANPVRTSARPALKRLHRAGVRTVMITGDQSATAFAVARGLDLADGGELRVLEAGQIANMPPELLTALAAQPHVFARVSPVDKLNIVKALQANGHIVAMTGDGVNDGPALRAADVGVAMGGEGGDVARRVADIVLASDDMDGIVEAIRLGRATYANIRKVLRYLVSTNASETFVMLGAALVDAGEPLTPMQLLWLNLATDALPALALGLEPPEADVLDQPPHDPSAPILGPADFRRVLREGSVMGVAALIGYFSVGGLVGGSRASTVTFHGLTLGQLLHAVASRSETRGLMAEFGRRPNPKLYGGLAISVLMQGAAQFLPPTRRLLGLAPLAPGDLLRIGAVAIGSSIVNDVVGRAEDRFGAHARIPRPYGESHVV